MGKKNVMTSIDDETHRLAKQAHINISNTLERALQSRLASVSEKENLIPGRIEFDFEERTMEGVKNILFINAVVKARRCQKCGLIWFVNDPNREWTTCKLCRGQKFAKNG